MNSFTAELDRKLANRVQVWPCSLWDHEWTQQYDQDEVGCGELLSLTHGEIIRAAHKATLKAGADALVTNTFGATAIVMQDYGAAHKVRDVNRESARLADEVAREMPANEESCLVVGSIGPTCEMLSLHPEASETRHEALISAYMDQAEALFEGGVRIFHVERCQDPRTAHSALVALARLESKLQCSLAKVVTAQVEPEGRMVLGNSVETFWKEVEPFKPQAFGVAGRLSAVNRALTTLVDVVNVPVMATVDALAVASPEGWLQSPESLSAAMVDLTNRFEVRVAGIGIEARPDFVLPVVTALRHRNGAHR
jgi:5-methyltetrahydrofolate--homocysteine methyltransferase